MADTVVTYDGAMRCRAVHGDSGAVIVADAPIEMGGTGDGFSPSDLLAVSLGGCILSIMAVATAGDPIDLSGATACVTKEMADAPRRIARLAVTVRVPGAVDDRLRRKLVAAANACPVHQALGIEAPISFDWGGVMRTVGLIGGMSWESSAEYYRLLNQGVRDRRGPTASAPCIMWSFDFAAIEALQHVGDWDALAAAMVDAARRLEGAGAEVLMICTNTMHKLAPLVEAAVSVPLLHIADPTAAAIKAAGIHRVGLLGTAFTMEQDFYKGRLVERHGLDVIVPDAEDRATVHRVIYDELVAGVVTETSRAAYRDVIARLVATGAEAVILGCTEIMLLVRPEDSEVPLFDTTTLHARAGVEAALSV